MQVTFVQEPGTFFPKAIARPENDQEKIIFELWASALIGVDIADLELIEIIDEQSGVFEGFSIGLVPDKAPADPFPVPSTDPQPDPPSVNTFAPELGEVGE